MRCTARWLLLFALTCLVSACSGLHPTAISGPATASGTWLASDTNSALLLQLLEAKDGTVSGSADYVQAATTDTGDPSQQTNLSVSGLRRNNDISLTINEGLGVTQTWAGKITGSSIALQIPQRDGSLAAVTLKHGSTTSFNDGVTLLRNAVMQQRADRL